LSQQPGLGSEHQVKTNTEQHQVIGKGLILSEQSMGKTDKERQPAPHMLHGSSSVAGASAMQIENLEIGATNDGAVEVFQRAATSKMCRRRGVKGHLMFECTATIFCEICKSADHAMI